MNSTELSTDVHEFISENFFLTNQKGEAWETEFFLRLERAAHLDDSHLSASAKSKLRVAFRIAERYLAFHYRVRRRLHQQSSVDLYEVDHQVWSLVPDSLRQAPKEWLGFIPLYPNGNLGDLSVVVEGAATHVKVEPIELFARILALRPLGIYLVHNHPSGDLTPSMADQELTQHVKRACDSIGLKFFGHGIVSSVGETWICDIDQAHESSPARKSQTRFNPAASTRARQSFRVRNADHDHSQKFSAQSGAVVRES